MFQQAFDSACPIRPASPVLQGCVLSGLLELLRIARCG